MVQDFIDSCARSIGTGAQAHVLLLRADEGDYEGASVHVGGGDLLNFGSCSYLGLEVRPELRAGVIAAVARYGTQFPFAKPQLECALYGELEALLGEMTGGRPVIASSATLLHLAALPALISPRDAVIVDRLAHASLMLALQHVQDVHKETLPHNDIEKLDARVAELSAGHDRVWYILDGVYSMSGSYARMSEIAALLARHPKLHLYSDDAHATSWTGLHGRGCALEALPDRSRVLVTLSLNKAFSAAGGALIVPDQDFRDRIRFAGAPMMFSGPIQPPMLGAAVASARLHLTPELTELQRRLASRIERLHLLARERGIKFGTTDRTPIAFVGCGPESATHRLFHALRRNGFYLAPAVFPAVPRDRSGLRLTASLHNTDEDTVRLMDVMAEELRRIPEASAYQASLP